jgi:serine O-acetyltransferase
MTEAALGVEAQAEAEPFLDCFRADLSRHFVYHPRASAWKKLGVALQVEGIWACGVYRYGRALRTRALPPIVAAIAWFAFRFLELWVRILTGIHLDVDARIGPGLYVGHHGSIFVGPGTRMGANCSIGQMCYLASAVAGAVDGGPTLGDRVYLGAGCKVVGRVQIGEGAAIGANSVVFEDVPRLAVVVGNPGKVVSLKGSSELIYLGVGAPPTTGSFALDAMNR